MQNRAENAEGKKWTIVVKKNVMGLSVYVIIFLEGYLIYQSMMVHYFKEKIISVKLTKIAFFEDRAW